MCHNAITLAKKYDRFRVLPYLLNNISASKLKQGDRESCLKIILRAYYVALAMENQPLVNFIKTDAEKELGIDIRIIENILLQ